MLHLCHPMSFLALFLPPSGPGPEAGAGERSEGRVRQQSPWLGVRRLGPGSDGRDDAEDAATSPRRPTRVCIVRLPGKRAALVRGLVPKRLMGPRVSLRSPGVTPILIPTPSPGWPARLSHHSKFPPPRGTARAAVRLVRSSMSASRLPTRGDIVVRSASYPAWRAWRSSGSIPGRRPLHFHRVHRCRISASAGIGTDALFLRIDFAELRQSLRSGRCTFLRIDFAELRQSLRSDRCDPAAHRSSSSRGAGQRPSGSRLSRDGAFDPRIPANGWAGTAPLGSGSLLLPCGRPHLSHDLAVPPGLPRRRNPFSGGGETVSSPVSLFRRSDGREYRGGWGCGDNSAGGNCWKGEWRVDALPSPRKCWRHCPGSHAASYHATPASPLGACPGLEPGSGVTSEAAALPASPPPSEPGPIGPTSRQEFAERRIGPGWLCEPPG